jgi:hypothetical protein
VALNLKLGPSALGPSTIVLERQCIEVMELQRYLGRVRGVLKGPLAFRIQELLEGLDGEIACCGDILAARVRSLASDQTVDLPVSQSPDYFWRISSGGNTGYRDMLDSLHSAYAHCARTTAESMSTIALLDDPESFAVLSWVWAATKQALSFIEMCLAGNQTLEWRPTNPPLTFSTVAKTYAPFAAPQRTQGSTILLHRLVGEENYVETRECLCHGRPE